MKTQNAQFQGALEVPTPVPPMLVPPIPVSSCQVLPRCLCSSISSVCCNFLRCVAGKRIWSKISLANAELSEVKHSIHYKTFHNGAYGHEHKQSPKRNIDLNVSRRLSAVVHTASYLCQVYETFWVMASQEVCSLTQWPVKSSHIFHLILTTLKEGLCQAFSACKYKSPLRLAQQQRDGCKGRKEGGWPLELWGNVKSQSSQDAGEITSHRSEHRQPCLCFPLAPFDFRSLIISFGGSVPWRS